MNQSTPANEMQFSLRTLLIGLVLLTVGLGLFVWYGQRLSLQARWLAIAWGMILFSLGVPYYFFLSWARAQANRKSGGRIMPAGSVVFHLLDTNLIPVFPHFLLVICAISGIFIVQYVSLQEQAQGLAVPPQKWLAEVGAIYAVLCLAFRALWDTIPYHELSRQYLCEHGLLAGFSKVIPWAGIRKWDWKPGFPNTARLWGTSSRIYLFPVEPLLRKETADVLNHYIARGPREGGTRPGRNRDVYLPPVPEPRK